MAGWRGEVFGSSTPRGLASIPWFENQRFLFIIADMIIAITLLTCLLAVNDNFGTLIFHTIKSIDSRQEHVSVGEVNASKYQKLRIRVENLESTAKTRTDYERFSVLLVAAEGSNEWSLAAGHDLAIEFHHILDVPPPTLRLKIQGKGKFVVHIWAS